MLKSRDKTNLSCFMMGGFEIVDYSDSINQLHRKLLTKILLNKWGEYRDSACPNQLRQLWPTKARAFDISSSFLYFPQIKYFYKNKFMYY